VVLFVVAAAFGYAVYGGISPPPLVAGLAAAAIPVGQRPRRRRARRELGARGLAADDRGDPAPGGHPRRSIPQALLTVGGRGPEEMRPAFAAAQREWLISTDFDRTLEVLKAQLADPTADAVCETLLIAHEVGGTDVDRGCGR
jgi:tight adherence protein B